MAMIATGERLRSNAWGRYYVTDECNGCGLCVALAPYNFIRSWDGTYYTVLDQPRGESEKHAVREALLACPLHCIKDDWATD
jgi:ferredoxin